jgi:hypothetical protein
MVTKSQTELLSEITDRLRDNNAGLISAADIRENMVNVVNSINRVVCSGDFNATFPFFNDVRAKRVSGQQNTGSFIVESGIKFQNGFGTGIQIVPYPGPTGISHNDLANLTQGNPHTQYLSTMGLNKAVGNLPMGDRWINSSGNLSASVNTNDRGLRFTYVNTNTELVNVGTKSTIKFDTDNSTMSTAKGVAQAWIRFIGSGNMQVVSSYNVTRLERTIGEDSQPNDGKYRIYFKDGLFNNANYVAIGTSNALSDDDDPSEFEINTVGITHRTPTSITFYVKNTKGNYVNASINDLVVFGNASGVMGDTGVTVGIESSP